MVRREPDGAAKPVARSRYHEIAFKGIAAAVTFPARALLLLIWIYQRTLSPVLPIVLGPSCGCRFAPTCSHYAAEAVQIHGAFRGSFLAARRLLKCTPLHPGGIDPVPPRRAKPACRRSTPLAASAAEATFHRTSSSRFRLTA